MLKRNFQVYKASVGNCSQGIILVVSSGKMYLVVESGSTRATL